MPIIDTHTHYGTWAYPMRQQSAADMVKLLASRGIRCAVVSSTSAIVYDFHNGNRALAEAIAPHPELFAYMTINLNYVEESLQELSTYARHPKFVGTKVHPLYCRQKLDSPNGRLLVRAIAEYGWPLLVHTYSSAIESPWNVLPVAQANPGLPIIMAHMGGDMWWEGIRVAKESRNLYLDPCASWADTDKLAIAVRELGAERILFGSDYSLFDPAHTLGMIEEADLSTEERELILGGNALRLFGHKILPNGQDC